MASVPIYSFLRSSIRNGLLVLRLPGGGKAYFGDRVSPQYRA
jgi:hypothetical protein